MYNVRRKVTISMIEITEEFLIKLKEKDNDAFSKLYNNYVKLIYHIAYSYTHNKEDSEDIVSEVFIKIISSIPSYQEKGKFKEWISMITRNVSLNFVTRNKYKEVLKDEELTNKTVDKDASYKDIIMLFEEFLDKDTMSIMTLKFIYNYKFKDIAMILGMSIGKVQGLYYDGLEKLRKVY